jgi:exopolysaccharide/PEP-CTERM locus tyrosine autokinase
VSLIENALAKFRRVGDGEPQGTVVVPRAIVAAAAAPKAPARVAREHFRRITIDPTALRNAGYLPEVGLERRFADHFRHIKRPLIDRALSGPRELRLMLVSSALPGDGKTFVSLNLALSMARERDTSVLLVDADAPRAHISEILGLRGQPGLLDALGDESVDVESLIVGTDLPGFEILPSGKFVENAPELLASTRMAEIAAQLGSRDVGQLVVFDSVPLLASSEARALMPIIGQVVLVARVGATPRSAVQQAVAAIDKKKLHGLVVNHAPLSSVGGYYGYGGYDEAPAGQAGRR